MKFKAVINNVNSKKRKKEIIMGSTKIKKLKKMGEDIGFKFIDLSGMYAFTT